MRAGERSDHALPHERALDLVALEELGDGVGGASRDREPEQLASPLVGEPLLQGVERGRLGKDQRADHICHLVPERVPPVVGAGVVLAYARDLLARARCVAPHEEVPSVGEWNEHARLFRVEREPILRQLQCVEDLRPEQAERIRGGRDAEPGRDLLGDARAPDKVARLQRNDPRAFLRERARGDQAVVTGADHDRVEVHRPTA